MESSNEDKTEQTPSDCSNTSSNINFNTNSNTSFNTSSDTSSNTSSIRSDDLVKSICRKLGILYGLAFPMIATNFCMLCNSILTLFWVGQFIGTTDAMSGVTLGKLIFNLLGLSVQYGLASGLSTLLSQARGTEKSITKLRQLYIKRTAVILIVVGIPLGIVSSFAEPIFIGLGQPLIASKIAGKYVIVLYWGSMVPQMTFYIQKVALNTQRKTFIPTVSVFVALGVHITVALYFLRGFGSTATPIEDLPFGANSFLAPALARISFCIVTSGIVGFYLFISNDNVCGTEFFCCSRSKIEDEDDAIILPPVFQWSGFSHMLSLCLPSMFLMVSEWWPFEVLSIIAGILPNAMVSIASNGILYCIASSFYQIFRGMGSATGILVGNALGSCDEIQSIQSSAQVASQAIIAKRWCWIGISSSAMLACILSGFLFYFRDGLPKIFTTQIDVVLSVSNASIPLIAAMTGYAVLMPSVQILQGCGLQNYAAIFCSIGYFLIGLPGAYLLAVSYNHGLNGIWFGNAVALWIGGLLSVAYIAFFVDWEEEVRKAQNRRLSFTYDKRTSDTAN